jgi:hypothetical protein
MSAAANTITCACPKCGKPMVLALDVEGGPLADSLRTWLARVAQFATVCNGCASVPSKPKVPQQQPPLKPQAPRHAVTSFADRSQPREVEAPRQRELLPASRPRQSVRIPVSEDALAAASDRVRALGGRVAAVNVLKGSRYSIDALLPDGVSWTPAAGPRIGQGTKPVSSPYPQANGAPQGKLGSIAETLAQPLGKESFSPARPNGGLVTASKPREHNLKTFSVT